VAGTSTVTLPVALGWSLGLPMVGPVVAVGPPLLGPACPLSRASAVTPPRIAFSLCAGLLWAAGILFAYRGPRWVGVESGRGGG